MDMCHLGIKLALIFLVYQWKSVQSASFMTFPEPAVPKTSNGTYVLNYGACFCGIENHDSKELTARPKAHFRTELFIECNPKGINTCQNRCKNESETLVSLLCLKSGHLESTKGHLFYNFCAAPKWERVGVNTPQPFCCHNNLPSNCATLPKFNNTVQVPQTTPHPTVEVKEVEEGTPVTENQPKENATLTPSEEQSRRNAGEEKPLTEHHLNTNTTHYLSENLRKSSSENKPFTEHHLNSNTTHYLSEHLRKSSTEDKPLTEHHLNTNTTHYLSEHLRKSSNEDKPFTEHHLKTNATHNLSFRRNSIKNAAEVKTVTNLEKPATSKTILESTTEKLNVTSLKNESININKTNATALNTTEPVINNTTLPATKTEATVSIQNKTASNNITKPTSSVEISGHSNESKTTKLEAATNTSKSINSNVTVSKSVSPPINTSGVINNKNATAKDIKNVTLTHRHASSTTNENVTVTNKTAVTTVTPAVNSTPTIQETSKGISTQANVHNTVNATSTLKETNATNGKATNFTSSSSAINTTLAATNATHAVTNTALAVNKTTNATAVKEVKNENTTQIKVPTLHQRSSHHKMLIDYNNETVVQANILNNSSSPNNGSKNGTNTQTTGALNEIKNKIASPTVASVNATENSTTNIKKESSTDPIALTTNKASENNSVALKKTEIVNGTAGKTNPTRGVRSMLYPSTNNSDEGISAANPDHSKVNLELLYSRYLEIPLTSRKSYANTSETNDTKPSPRTATAPNIMEHPEYASENFASRTLKSLDGKNTVPNNPKINATLSANNTSTTISTTKAVNESSFRIQEIQTQKSTPTATLKEISNKTQTVTPNVILKEVLNKTQTVTPSSNISAINNLSAIKNTAVKSEVNGTVINGSGSRNSLSDHLSKRDISLEQSGKTDHSRSVKSIQKEDIQTGSQFSDPFIASTKGTASEQVAQTNEFNTSTPATTVNKFKTKLPTKKWETENSYGNWKLDTGAARNKESTTTPITANKEFGNGTNSLMNIPYPNNPRPGNRTREPKIPRPLLQNEGIKAIPTATTTAATAPINLSEKPTLLSANIPKINYHPSMMQNFFHPQNKPQGSLRQLE